MEEKRRSNSALDTNYYRVPILASFRRQLVPLPVLRWLTNNQRVSLLAVSPLRLKVAHLVAMHRIHMACHQVSLPRTLTIRLMNARNANNSWLLAALRTQPDLDSRMLLPHPNLWLGHKLDHHLRCCHPVLHPAELLTFLILQPHLELRARRQFLTTDLPRQRFNRPPILALSEVVLPLRLPHRPGEVMFHVAPPLPPLMPLVAAMWPLLSRLIQRINWKNCLTNFPKHCWKTVRIPLLRLISTWPALF